MLLITRVENISSWTRFWEHPLWQYFDKIELPQTGLISIKICFIDIFTPVNSILPINFTSRTTSKENIGVQIFVHKLLRGILQPKYCRFRIAASYSLSHLNSTLGSSSRALSKEWHLWQWPTSARHFRRMQVIHTHPEKVQKEIQTENCAHYLRAAPWTAYMHLAKRMNAKTSKKTDDKWESGWKEIEYTG